MLMHNRTSEVVEGLAISSGIGVSLVDIQNILSIILLTFNVLWLILKVILKIVRYYKNDGKLDAEEISDIESDISDINDKVRK